MPFWYDAEMQTEVSKILQHVFESMKISRAAADAYSWRMC